MSQKRPALLYLIREYPLGVLLASLMLTIIGAPLMHQITERLLLFRGQASITPLVLIVTITSAYAVWHTAKSRATAIILGGIAVTLLYLSTVIQHSSLTIVHLIAQTVFLTYVTFVIVRTVFTAPIVDGNILCGAASVYLMMGLLVGFVYTLIEFAEPQSFSVSAADGHLQNKTLVNDPGWLIYFSYTTLTTVGFGDIIPVKNFARSAAVVEAVIGQIMLVVMMARLVGLHVAQVSVRQNQPVEFSIEDPRHPHHPHHKKPGHGS